MLAIFKDLLQHKWYADTRLIAAVRSSEVASSDQEIRTLLHHIILANRFWLAATLGKPFAHAREAEVPNTLDDVIQLFRDTYQQELECLETLSDAGLQKRIESSFFPNNSFSVAEAYMQVCMHSHGHRAQCAKRLRALGIVPPTLDFILWLKERPAPDWTVTAAHQTYQSGGAVQSC